MRKYSVADIEDLRDVVRAKIIFGNYNGSWQPSRGYREAEVAMQVEAMVRTHMLAGHYAAQLRASDPPRAGRPLVFRTDAEGRREICS